MQRDCGLEEVKKRCSDCDTNGGTKDGRAKWGLCKLSNSRSVGVGSGISGKLVQTEPKDVTEDSCRVRIFL